MAATDAPDAAPSAEEAVAATALLSRRRAVAALAALALGTFLFVTTETLPVGLLPQIAHGVHASLATTGLLVTAYAGVVVASSIPLTLATRRLPRRRLFVMLLAVAIATDVVVALAGSYAVLLGARVVTALAQALFWSIVTPTAAGLFAPEVRARALSLLFAGTGLAGVIGVPADTWLGQQTSWRVAFLALAGLCAVSLVGAAICLPAGRGGEGQVTRGSAPDRRRYALLVAVTLLGITGTFTAYTYVNPFLTQVAHFSESAVGPLLLVSGLCGIASALVLGRVAGVRPLLAIVLPTAALVLALFGYFTLGHLKVVAVVCIALSGFAGAGMAMMLSIRVLEVAPGRSDVAVAGSSSAYNVGIGSGSALGSGLLHAHGVRSTTLVGGVLAAVALALLLAEPAVDRRSRISTLA